jgi:hypothetical protein
VLALLQVPIGVHAAVVNKERIERGLSWQQMAREFGLDGRARGNGVPFLALQIRIARGDDIRSEPACEGSISTLPPEAPLPSDVIWPIEPEQDGAPRS